MKECNGRACKFLPPNLGKCKERTYQAGIMPFPANVVLALTTHGFKKTFTVKMQINIMPFF